MHSTIRQHSPLLIGLSIAGLLSAIAVLNPAGLGDLWICRFNRLTGWYCPGCGATRAARSLLHGDVSTAFRQHMLLLPGLAAAGGYLLLAIVRLKQDRPLPVVPAWMWWSAGGVTVAYSLLRNLY